MKKAQGASVLANLSAVAKRYAAVNINEIRFILMYENIRTWRDGRTPTRYLDGEAIKRLDEAVPRFRESRKNYNLCREIHPAFGGGQADGGN